MKGIIFICCFAILQNLQSQVTICLDSFPALKGGEPAEIYVAGNFNGWSPGDPHYKMNKSGNSYLLTFSPENTTNIEFKFTRGTWDTGETNADGSYKENRSYHYNPGMTVHEKIGAWQDAVKGASPEVNLKVVHIQLFAPQLHTEKTIRIWLPCDYTKSERKYPVLYMMDAQNLFDNTLSFAGEWGIDESMDSICKTKYPSSIVVAIDHAGQERLTEYSPWVNAEYGGGHGDEFAEFVVKTLKPHIDSIYRTLADRNNTAIGGSSMGGLMSLYFVTQYNDVFSKALIFSPAFWFAKENFDEAANYKSDLPTKMFFICGGLEGDEYMNDMINIFSTLKNKNLPEHYYRLIVESEGRHSESFWRNEFIEAYGWLWE